MKQTLEACEKTHSHDVFDHAYIPERIIDVRPEVARLTLREDHIQSHRASTLKYAALSYCWGSGENQATTTVATLSGRQAGITETELPLAIRDAIKVTRSLSIPFLWVDALCILQDDPSDWERHCTEMHNIYGSAQVALCAANSRSCDKGFVRQSGRIIRIPFQSRQAPEIEGSFLIQHNGLPERFDFTLGAGTLFLDTFSSRWGSRGWVFQEKVLSTRRLVFGAHDLYFLCSESHQRRGQAAITHGYDHHIGKSAIEGDPNVIYGNWDRIIQDYSHYQTSSFTHATDILPALSGLAQLFHGPLKDDFYAGHWGRNLHRSLLWTAGGFHTHVEPFWSASFSRLRSKVFIVPTWSVLNRGYTETFFRFTYFYGTESEWYNCRSEIKLVEGKALVTGANPFGALAGCSLRLRGYTLDLNHKEVDVSTASRAKYELRDSNSLRVHGRHFGALTFDCKPEPHADGSKCVSESEFGQFKLLLLMRCDYYIPEVTPSRSGSEAESGEAEGCSEGYFSGEAESSSGEESDERDFLGVEGSGEAITGEWKEGCGGLDSSGQEQMSGEEVSAPTDDSSDDRQRQQSRRSRSSASTPPRTGKTIRKGFGLIISPTGNDGEFCRVGVFSPVGPWDTIDSLGGDIRELQSLAQMETVQLV